MNNEHKDIIKFDYTDAEDEFEFLTNALYDFFKNIAITQIEYEGLDAINKGDNLGLTSEIIEEELFENGMAIWFNDKEKGILCLKGQGQNGYNVYHKPLTYQAIGFGYSKSVSADNCVVIKNNALCKPTGDLIYYYCTKIADIELTKNLQRNAHKTPIVMECDSDTQLSAKNIFKKIRACEPVILKNKNKTRDGEITTTLFNTNQNCILDKLNDDQISYIARILTLLGIDNYVEDKAERVQSAEVEANEEYILASCKASMKLRQEACEQINKKYNLNIKPVYSNGKDINYNDNQNDFNMEEEENE